VSIAPGTISRKGGTWSLSRSAVHHPSPEGLLSLLLLKKTAFQLLTARSFAFENRAPNRHKPLSRNTKQIVLAPSLFAQAMPSMIDLPFQPVVTAVHWH
jgi:hypothetical protein